MRNLRKLRLYAFCSSLVTVRDHYVCASGSSKMGYLTPNSASGANDQSDSPAQLFFGRLTSQLCLFHCPIFDSKGFDWGQGYIVAEALEACRVHAFSALRESALHVVCSC